MIRTSQSLPNLLKVLAEPTRLRILALLDEAELGVNELSRSLGLSQSRVSNHLRVLREADLLIERHEGKNLFLRHAVSQLPNSSSSNGSAQGEREFAPALWTLLQDQLNGLPEHGADRLRLQAVLAERAGDGAAFFDAVAGHWDKIGVDFATGQARQRVAAALLPGDQVIADLGCGTGYMAASVFGFCTQLICVDSSAGMLSQAQTRLSGMLGDCKVELRQGELDQLPIEDNEVHGAMLGMVLHHLDSLEEPLAEVARILKPGGRLAILEMAPHREDWMHETLGDRHLGLEATDVIAALRRAGFEDVRFEPLEDQYQPNSPEKGRVSLPLYLLRASLPLGN